MPLWWSERPITISGKRSRNVVITRRFRSSAAAGYAAVTPFGTPPDETAHALYVQHLAQERTLPVLRRSRRAAYEFHRDRTISSNDFFSNRGDQPKPKFIRNQFGGEVDALGHERQRVGQRERSLEDGLRRDAVRDVDDLDVGRNPLHHTMTRADEVVL